MRRMVFHVSVLILLAGCDRSDAPAKLNPLPAISSLPSAEPVPQFKLTFENEWEKRIWLQKLSKKLRMGSAPSEEEFAKWLEMSPDAVVNEIISGPAFAETVFDFNLFYLGFKNDRTARFSDNNFGLATRFPSAAISAKEYARGGDYLKLWDYYQPFLLQPLNKAYLPEQNRREESSGSEPAQPAKTQAEIRAILFARILSQVERQLAAVEAPETNETNICAVLSLDQEEEDSADLSNAGLSFALENKLSTEYFFEASLDCFLTQTTDVAKVRNSLIRYREVLPKWISLIESMASEEYHPNSIAELKELDLTKLDLAQSTAFSDFEFWLALQNSSTNLNRRRAAYILRRYFCDDLTPINIAVPKEHGRDRHASDPSCAACHYKLDPMAGFFRNIGIVGIDFKNSDMLIFDDQARIDRAEYEQNWLSAEDDQKLNIGFIRSVTKPALNSYATELPQLFEIIRSAPEAQRCLVKRLSEYFVDEDQIFDDDYLGYLTAQFSSAQNSSQGLKLTISSLAMSKSFAQTDPNAQECYDYAPGVLASNRPPCQVAAVLKRNCATCHSAASAAGGLNLENWVVNHLGEKTFAHFRGGQAVERQATMESIIDRLSTVDLDRRMPLNQNIGAIDRDIIFKWAQSMLQSTEESAGE